MLKHPLVFSVFHTPQLNAMLNESFRKKKALAEKCLEEKDYRAYVWLHERPFRVYAIQGIEEEVKSDGFRFWWSLLGMVWQDSENIWQNRDFWNHNLDVEGPKVGFMDRIEEDALAKLQFPLTVYRGHQRQNKWGLSWSLMKPKARWFATRYDVECGDVTEIVVEREDALAYFISRGEEEIVVRPSSINRIKWRRRK